MMTELGIDIPVSTRLALKTRAHGVELSTHLQEHIIGRLRRSYADVFSMDRPERLWGPPVISAESMRRTGYGRSFPQLLGTVHTDLEERELPGERTGDLAGPESAAGTQELMLVASACHHVYPLFQGKEITKAASVMVEGRCFRNDSPNETGRLRSFRQFEVVHVAAPPQCAHWREDSLTRVEKWLSDLGIQVSKEVANDPFFGRGSSLMRSVQRKQLLKWEFRADLGDGVKAIGSSNYHKNHFSEAFEFRGPSGAELHTACIGFGLERLVLALVHAHGGNLDSWPEAAGGGSGPTYAGAE
ncbi:hypothetical protein [Streptomyces sp. NPDC091217]|uniref:hypothetical protein n=1 Tax=Streptomyces sp. NPDC091217 TaxID=3365975 RepID=UPI0037FD2731